MREWQNVKLCALLRPVHEAPCFSALFSSVSRHLVWHNIGLSSMACSRVQKRLRRKENLQQPYEDRPRVQSKRSTMSVQKSTGLTLHYSIQGTKTEIWTLHSALVRDTAHGINSDSSRTIALVLSIGVSALAGHRTLVQRSEVAVSQ